MSLRLIYSNNHASFMRIQCNAATMEKNLSRLVFNVLDHILHSSDLASSDLFKFHFEGKILAMNFSLRGLYCVHSLIERISVLRCSIEKLQLRWQKCISYAKCIKNLKDKKVDIDCYLR